ncbi:MAG TPA: hypothetical protein DCK83_08670 [Gallionellaceae bacterium]|nr:hypothetical protein [Gallionellaceae bacterium]
MSRNSAWFDPEDTAVHHFTQDNCPDVPELHGEWIEIYAELSAGKLDELQTTPITAIREAPNRRHPDAKPMQELAIEITGLDLEGIAAWIKAWSGFGRKNVRPTVANLGQLKVHVFEEIKRVVTEHAQEATRKAEPVLDPTPEGSGDQGVPAESLTHAAPGSSITSPAQPVQMQAVSAGQDLASSSSESVA